MSVTQDRGWGFLIHGLVLHGVLIKGRRCVRVCRRTRVQAYHLLHAHAQVCPTLRPHGLYPPRLLCPWDSPGKNTGVGCYSLLQGIFPTQGSNLHPLPCRQILYRPEPPGKTHYLVHGCLYTRVGVQRIKGMKSLACNHTGKGKHPLWKP